MPLYALVARDRPGLERRKRARPAHLDHLAKIDEAGHLRFAGPLLNGDRDMVGSLIILEADSIKDAKATYAQDPYVVNEVFEHYDVMETLQVFPREA